MALLQLCSRRQPRAIACACATCLCLGRHAVCWVVARVWRLCVRACMCVRACAYVFVHSLRETYDCSVCGGPSCVCVCVNAGSCVRACVRASAPVPLVPSHPLPLSTLHPPGPTPKFTPHDLHPPPQCRHIRHEPAPPGAAPPTPPTPPPFLHPHPSPCRHARRAPAPPRAPHAEPRRAAPAAPAQAAGALCAAHTQGAD
jgi:hypothetical protein